MAVRYLAGFFHSLILRRFGPLCGLSNVFLVGHTVQRLAMTECESAFCPPP